MTTYGRIQWRRDTAEDWVALNPILLDGEVGYETDTGRLKIGDNVKTWSALPYFGSTSDFAAMLVWEALQKPPVIAAGENPDEARAVIDAASPEDIAEAMNNVVDALGNRVPGMRAVFLLDEAGKLNDIQFEEF